MFDEILGRFTIQMTVTIQQNVKDLNKNMKIKHFRKEIQNKYILRFFFPSQDLHKALVMLGLNPTEQEMVDIPNQIAR